MKAPDKVYCERCSDGIYSHIHRWENADNIEYIRKDALLEWVKERKNINLEEADEKNDMFSYGIATGFAAMIDKLNSM